MKIIGGVFLESQNSSRTSCWEFRISEIISERRRKSSCLSVKFHWRSTALKVVLIYSLQHKQDCWDWTCCWPYAPRMLATLKLNTRRFRWWAAGKTYFELWTMFWSEKIWIRIFIFFTIYMWNGVEKIYEAELHFEWFSFVHFTKQSSNFIADLEICFCVPFCQRKNAEIFHPLKRKTTFLLQISRGFLLRLSSFFSTHYTPPCTNTRKFSMDNFFHTFQFLFSIYKFQFHALLCGRNSLIDSCVEILTTSFTILICFFHCISLKWNSTRWWTREKLFFLNFKTHPIFFHQISLIFHSPCCVLQLFIIH